MMPPFGHAAFVSQSGALGVSVLDYAREYGIGISQFVSVGNKPDVSGNDLLEYWETDPTVKVILMYVENFGNPTRFLEIASRITQSKPIVAVKAGRTRAGARAAFSHTGALAASDVAVDALLTQAGVLRAGTIEELFDIALGFGVRTLPRSRRTAVVTNAGGPGILAADALDAAGLTLPAFAPATVASIRPLLPRDVPVGNPLDLIASATPEGYRASLTALLRDPGVDCVVPIFIPPLGVETDAVARAICDATRAVPGKPVLAVLMGRQGLPEWRAELHAAGVPTYIFPESAARAIAALNRHRENLGHPREVAERSDVDRWTVDMILANARADGRTWLMDVEAFAVLDAYGIPTTRAHFAVSKEEALIAASAIGFPVAMKIVSRDIPHKSEVGGVALDVGNEEAAADAYERMLLEASVRVHDACIDGVSVSAMVHGGLETIVGFARDPLFGPLLMFGLGGVHVEALRDVAFRIGPLSERDASEMLAGIRGSAILDGIRGRAAVDRDAIRDTILRLSRLAADFPEIIELDVNPLLAFEHRVVAVDCRIALAAVSGSSPEPAGHSQEDVWR
jgi:acyl-CoA synthetase (NDP forming)